MNSKNKWNLMAQGFDTFKNPEELTVIAADNMYIAWPPILDLIHAQFPYPHGMHALDYGCGTGGFAKKLSSLGFHVTGIDYADEMIAKACEYYGSKIHFITGDYTDINKTSRVHIISSIMTLQFLSDTEIEQAFRTFNDVLDINGLFIFAVFNPEWVKDCLSVKKRFTKFDSANNPHIGMIHFDNGVEIPVFIRSSEEYAKLAQANGFIKIMEAKPSFTAEFLRKYPISLPTQHSEYLIMGFKRT